MSLSLIKVTKFAESIGVSKVKAYQMIKDGTIPKDALVKIPGVRGTRVDLNKIEQLMNEDWKVS